MTKSDSNKQLLASTVCASSPNLTHLLVALKGKSQKPEAAGIWAFKTLCL